ncbi:MAG: hypothetical protein OXC91_10515 [Rhodobacteraceae bacterium]|nr:hypothetical protein [Paracoccaceae bacterium]
MLIVLVLVIVGALLGHWHARRLDGTRHDRLHYSVVYAILFGLLGLFAALLLGHFLP